MTMQFRGIDLLNAQDRGVYYEPLVIHEHEGHQVAWVIYQVTQLDGTVVSGRCVMCECDVQSRPPLGGCPHVQAVCRHVAVANAEAVYSDEELQACVLGLVNRVAIGEWVGQRDETLTLNLITLISGVDRERIARVTREMMQARRLVVQGAIIMPWSTEYEPRDDDDSELNDLRPPADQQYAFTGQLNFMFEQGSEGGYWAINDHRSQRWSPVDDGLLRRMPVRASDGRSGVVLDFLAHGVPVSLPSNADHIEFETTEGTIARVPVAQVEQSRYDMSGLHILRTGDWLEVYSPDGAIRWRGYVRLRHFPSFTESARGMWIHTAQRNVEREAWAAWFHAGLQARVVLAPRT
jgi:hypothetical protein